MTRLLVIGATGNVGSATVRAALNGKIPTLAFLRDPTKLSTEITSAENNNLLTVIKGDAKSAQSVQSAISDQSNDIDGPVTAVVIAAPMGSMRKRGTTGYEEIAHNVLKAVKSEQDRTRRKLKVWIMSGGAVMDHPDFPGKRLGTFMPVSFYEEYNYLTDWLNANCEDVDWTMNCPALIKSGPPSGPYYHSVGAWPDWKKPFLLTRLLPFGRASNIMYNWMTGPVTFDTLGQFMVDHLNPDGNLKGKRVGVLENPGSQK